MNFSIAFNEHVRTCILNFAALRAVDFSLIAYANDGRASVPKQKRLLQIVDLYSLGMPRF